MRWIWCSIVFLASLAMVQGASPASSIIKYHFAGGEVVVKNTNSPQFTKALLAPQGEKLKKRFLTRFAGEIANAANLKDEAAAKALEPLVSDFFRYESFGEFFGDEQGSFIFGIALPPQRAETWKSGLAKTGKISGAKDKIIFAGGKEIRISSKGKWLILAKGNADAGKAHLQSIEASKPPVFDLTTNWLRAEIDWTRVPAKNPFSLDLLKDCKTDLALFSRSGDVRVLAKLIYPKPVKWNPAPWQIPTNLIGNPNNLVGFTAARNIEPFINLPPAFQKLTPGPFTNQIYTWTLPQLPFLTYAAMPVYKKDGVLEAYAKQLQATFGAQGLGPFELKDDKSQIIWKGPTIPRGHINLTNANGRTYLAGGFFPPVGQTNELKSPLWNEVISKKNLIYYDWEITHPRLGSWWVLADFLPVLPPQDKWAVGTRSAVGPWFEAIAPHIENTITEATLSAPNEVTIIRKAPALLTGLEIVKLGFWAAQEPK